MDPNTASQLVQLNHEFYTQFAADFARTRRTWPPGFERILPYARRAANVLDLGCGNARLLSFLSARGWRGGYTGLDGSPSLVEMAQVTAAKSPAAGSACFFLADFASAGWTAPLGEQTYEAIACLAALHHVPGRANRARFLAESAARLAPGGRLIVSTWQFLGSPRLRTRLIPWEATGIPADRVEPGDYLLAWGGEKAGRRYCALIEEPDLAAMAAGAGLTPVASFRSDGLEGDLTLYMIFAT